MADQGSIANLKQNINENIYDNTDYDITGGRLNTVLQNIVDTLGLGVKDFFNVNEYRERSTAYNNAADARSAVPDEVKKAGLVIAYLLSDGWYIDQFNGNTSDWNNQALWQQTKVIIRDLTTDGDFAITDSGYNAIVLFRDGHIITKNFKSYGVNSKLNTIEAGAQVNETKVLNIAYDFAITDENGMAVVAFRDGHIITKNFDSRNINPNILKFRGKKIGLIADSITTYSGYLPSDISGYDGETYATWYPNGDVNAVEKTWWWKMAQKLGLNPQTDISNCAWSGSRVSGNSDSNTDAYAGCSNRRINDLTLRGFTPDIIICFISCNDWGNTPNVPIGTWSVNDPVPAGGTITTMREAYALMLYKIHSTYPNARVFCCTNMDDKARDSQAGYPPTNASGVSVFDWNKNIMEIAEAFGCDIINMHDCGINYANLSHFVHDAGLHPNAAGMEIMAQKVVAELIAKY